MTCGSPARDFIYDDLKSERRECRLNHMMQALRWYRPEFPANIFPWSSFITEGVIDLRSPNHHTPNSRSLRWRSWDQPQTAEGLLILRPSVWCGNERACWIRFSGGDLSRGGTNSESGNALNSAARAVRRSVYDTPERLLLDHQRFDWSDSIWTDRPENWKQMI